MKFEKVEKSDHQALIEIWEASVRATHDFLKEEDLISLKPLILEQYFDAVNLICIRSKDGKIAGFCGTYEDKIEMLFISPDAMGKGIGSALTEYAMENLKITRVDVNEQNKKALGFYEYMGFKVVGRSELDGQGKPYPLLHMEL